MSGRGVCFGPACGSVWTSVPGLKEVWTGGGKGLGKTLVITQVAISLVLLVGASLFSRTLIHVRTLDDGFRRDGVLILLGREFDQRDSPSSRKVAVVNETFARHYFGEASPLGKHVNNAEIVGVVKDVMYFDLREAFPRTVYFAALQNSSAQSWS